MSTTRNQHPLRRRVTVAGLVAAQLAAGVGLAATADAATYHLRESVIDGNTQINGESAFASVSGDGTYVAFTAAATNLTGGTRHQVYLRDVWRSRTELVSVDYGRGLPNGQSYGASISDDGRYVAFQSDASNLVSGDTNGRSDIFVKDRSTGTLTRVSVSGSGAQGNGTSARPTISGDGRFVAYDSTSWNLVAGDTNGHADVFVFDRVTRTSTRASVGLSGVQGNGGSFRPSLSHDGSTVAFHSTASNLITAGGTNHTYDVYVGSRTRVSQRVSVPTGGGQANGASGNPVISDNGHAVAFESKATNLVGGDSNGRQDVFHHDLRYRVTTLVSKGHNQVGPGDTPAWGNSGKPGIDASGRIVTYSSNAINLVDNSYKVGIEDVYVTNLNRSRATQTTLVSLRTSDTWPFVPSTYPALSSNGRVAVFHSEAANLVSGDTNGKNDVFRRILP